MPALYSKVLLSNSVNGSNISVTGSNTSSLTTIHTSLTASNSIDEIYVYATNNNTSSVTTTLYWGNSSSLDVTSFTLNPISGRTLIADGRLLQNGLSIYAAIDTGSVSIDGFVNRITDTTIDPRVYDWANRILYFSGSIPSVNTQIAASNFLRGMDSDGLTPKILTLNIIAPDSLNAAITPLISVAGYSQWLNSNFVTSDLSVNGLVGNGSNKSLDTGFNPITYFFNNTSAGISIYGYTLNSAAQYDVGARDGTFSFYLLANFSGGSYFDCWNDTDRAFTGTGPGSGFYCCNRISSTDAKIYYGSSTTASLQIASYTTAITTTRPNSTTLVYAMPGLPTFSNNTLSFVAIHRGFTASEALKFFNRVQALRVSLGGGFR